MKTTANSQERAPGSNPFLYLINPASDFPAYYGAEVLGELGLQRTAFVADLATVTVAALAPTDFRIEICDENVSLADLEHPAELVGITGKATQTGRMLELARAFRRRGKRVLIGGPVASLDPQAVRADCDILVRGELEPIAERLFADLRSGRWHREYQGGPADMATSPAPRWNLYPNHRALQGCLQTSRGCPFNCEFCDTIAYVGRRQRHKPPEQVLRELDQLYALGYRSVFLADDNLTAHRPKARALLQALADWNRSAPHGRMHFTTQISMDAAAHPELLALAAEAGLSEAFVGIETPNPDSLRECGKRQNLGYDLGQRLAAFVAQGVGVIGGLIVGFDADAPEIFRRHYEFAMDTPVPSLSVNALMAPPGTPLFERAAAEGRLHRTPGPVSPWWTNLEPRQMSRDQLTQGIRWLLNRLYRPAAFEARMQRFIDVCQGPPPERRAGGIPHREVNLQAVSAVRRVARLGPDERDMLARLAARARAKPETERHLFANLFRYMQFRALCEQGGIWDPGLGERSEPRWEGDSS